MLNLTSDAWASYFAIFMIFVSMVYSILRKLSRKRTAFTWVWFGTEVTAALFIAMVAWQMHPFLPTVSAHMPRDVFAAIAIHCATRFMQKLEDMIVKVK